MTVPKPMRMDAETFLTWAIKRPEGERYELANGEVVAMAPERAEHALTKLAAARALHDAVARAGLSCQVFPDGMAVRIGDATVYEPDAFVRCGDPVDPEAIEVEDPVIVLEVLSPSTRARDAGAKLEDHFRLPSLRHYLILKTDTRAAIHHVRADDGTIATHIVTEGSLELTPPGLVIDLAALFP